MTAMRFLPALGLCLIANIAQARAIDPGSVWLSAGVGPAFKIGGSLGASAAYLSLSAQGEYAVTSVIGVLGEINLGVSGTMPLRGRFGAKYRLSGIDLPISPYVQAQLSVGRLFDVLGADLTYLGVRAGVGADYFLTADLSVGAIMGLDLGSTLGTRPAMFGTFEVLAMISYAIFR